MRLSKTIYYDAFITGLVPVKPVAISESGRVSVEVLERTGAYRAGETLDIGRECVVRKILDASGPFIKVCELTTAELKGLTQ